ncbi:HAL/PAL/TAL family ammonia-lyase [Micromonospora fulviviridis]|uniref:Aromatic amino acid ammonia-lyase n=1 Tax=Micromonospora fulviviridis TaxID=47860 RepID=A0ABV2VUU9_9ACTN
MQVKIDGESLDVAGVCRVAAQPGTRVLFTPSAERRMMSSRHVLSDLLNAGTPVYGVTTGLGDSVVRRSSPTSGPALQQALVASYLNGTGPIASPELARAAMLVRLNCLARGDSAISSGVVDRLVLFLEHDVLPMIPERGSVGASGDLMHLCYLAAPLVGEAEVCYRGAVRPSREVLDELGLEPLRLEPKDTIALVNGTSFSTALAALVTGQVEDLVIAAEAATALATEALLGNRGHFAAFINERKPHPGQVTSARRIRSYLKGSGLALDHGVDGDRSGRADLDGFVRPAGVVQNRYSIRCAPHVIGVLRDTLSWVKPWVETEINSSNDNPLFDSEFGTVHTGGNFYAGHIAQAMDALKPALANVADLLDRQLALLVDEKFNNGLSANLVPDDLASGPDAALHHGFKGMQIVASGLTAEALKLCAPAGVHSRSTESHMEDKVSMSGIAARDARTVLELVTEVTAIQLIAACQAVELRCATASAPGTAAVRQAVRERVVPMRQGRRMDHDIQAVVDLIRSGGISKIKTEGENCA